MDKKTLQNMKLKLQQIEKRQKENEKTQKQIEEALKVEAKKLEEKNKKAEKEKARKIQEAEKKEKKAKAIIEAEKKELEKLTVNLKPTKTLTKNKKKVKSTRSSNGVVTGIVAAIATLAILTTAKIGINHIIKNNKEEGKSPIPSAPTPIDINQLMNDANKLNGINYSISDYQQLILFLNGNIADATMSDYDNIIKMFSDILNQEDKDLINTINVEETPETFNFVNYASAINDPAEFALIFEIQSARQELLKAIASGNLEEALLKANIVFEQEINFVWNVTNRANISDEVALLGLNLFKHSNNAIISLNENFSITKDFVNDKGYNEQETIYLKDFFNTIRELDKSIQTNIYKDCVNSNQR